MKGKDIIKLIKDWKLEEYDITFEELINLEYNFARLKRYNIDTVSEIQDDIMTAKIRIKSR